jgi:vancomycin resistance protein YoaR
MGVTQPKTAVIVRNTGQSQRHRGSPFGLILFVLILLGVAVSLLNWEQGYAGAIYPGVTIAGIPVGGLTPEQALQRLAPLNQAALQRVIHVTAGAYHWKTTPQQLGLRLNLESLVQQAYALGRGTDALDRYGTQISLLLHGRQFALAGNYERSKLDAFLRMMAIAVYRQSQPATVTLRQQHALLTVQAQSGRALDQSAAEAALVAALGDPRQTLVTAPVRTVPPSVSEAEGRREVAALQAILKTHLDLRFGQQHWLLDSRVIAPAIALTTVIAPGGAATYQHTVNPQVLLRFVNDIGAQIDRPMREATVSVHGYAITVVPAQTGYRLDRTATVQLLTQAILQGGTQTIDLPVSMTLAQTPTSVAQQAAFAASTLIRYPIALTYGQLHWWLTPAQLGSLLAFTPRRDPLVGPQVALRVDPTRLPAVLGPELAAISIAPRDARFVVHGNRVVLIPSADGTRVDLTALAVRIERHTRGATIPIPMQHYAPQLTTAQAQAMGIHDLLISHSTYFPGSSAARLTNIDAAVRHLDGQLIAPGAVFSFNQRIGPITPQGGYVQGIDIIDNQDVPGIGGGVCQVAVTLFQTAIFSGMKILERVPHANIVSYYNPIGMDATVYVSPQGPDVKFQNNTGHWVLIDFVEDLQHYRLTARFFGTNPHFRVVVRGPFITDLPDGDVNAVFYRTVYDAQGNVLLNAHFDSHYVPVGASN